MIEITGYTVALAVHVCTSRAVSWLSGPDPGATGSGWSESTLNPAELSSDKRGGRLYKKALTGLGPETRAEPGRVGMSWRSQRAG